MCEYSTVQYSTMHCRDSIFAFRYADQINNGSADADADADADAAKIIINVIQKTWTHKQMIYSAL